MKWILCGLLTFAAIVALPLIQPATAQQNCDPSYPTLCIPPGAPDLDCKDVDQTNFPVQGSDPHRFDGDHDGIGCEA